MTAAASAPLPVAALRPLRAAALAVQALLAAGFLVGLVIAAYRPRTALALWTSPGTVQALGRLGWDDGPIAAGFMVLEAIVALASLIAALLVVRGANGWFRLYLGTALALYGTMSGSIPLLLDIAFPGLHQLGALLQGLAWTGLFPLAYFFPDGRPVPRWSVWLAAAWAAYLLFGIASPALGLPADSAPATVLLLLLFGSVAAAAAYRYLRVSGDEERGRTRGVVLTLALRFALMLVTFVVPVGRVGADSGATQTLGYLAILVASYLLAALLPLVIAVGAVRNGLLGIELWTNRALLQTALTASVVVGYVIVVASIGTLWPRIAATSSLIAAIVAALAAAPVQLRLQQAVERLVYGRRREPYAVLSALGDRLAAVDPLDEVVPDIVRTIGTELKLGQVRLRLDAPVVIDAAHGAAPGPPAGPEPIRFELRHGERAFGRLEVSPRPGERLGESDVQLLARLSRQMEDAVYAVALTRELRLANERIVAATDAERRRLHRDLHDGLGPTIASIHQRIAAARTLVGTRGPAAERLLDEAAGATHELLGELRRLVYELRPTRLDELGLVGALEHTCRELGARAGALRIELRAAPLPPLPPEVELVAYRIAGEAVTNAVRHSGAHRCVVRLETASGCLSLEVRDDGVGIAAVPSAGTGIGSMRARAESVGGTLELDGGSGTRLHALLPIGEPVAQPAGEGAA